MTESDPAAWGGLRRALRTLADATTPVKAARKIVRPPKLHAMLLDTCGALIPVIVVQGFSGPRYKRYRCGRHVVGLVSLAFHVEASPFAPKNISGGRAEW